MMKTNGKTRHIRITHLHRLDGFYSAREKIIGMTGEFTPDPVQFIPGYFMGSFQSDNSSWGLVSNSVFFYGVRYKRI